MSNNINQNTTSKILINNVQLQPKRKQSQRVQRKAITKQSEDLDTTQAITKLMSQPNVIEIFNQMGRTTDPTEIARLNQSLQQIMQPVLQGVTQTHVTEICTNIYN